MPLMRNLKSPDPVLPVALEQVQEEPKNIKPQIMSRLKGVAPWLVSLLILQQVLTGHDLQAVLNAFFVAQKCYTPNGLHTQFGKHCQDKDCYDALPPFSARMF